MGETSENQVTAALTFKVPNKVGWSVQSNDRSWTGSKLGELTDCLAQEVKGGPITFSLSVIFELTRNEGTVKLLSD